MPLDEFEVEAYRGTFLEEPLSGPARLIYQLLLMARLEKQGKARGETTRGATNVGSRLFADEAAHGFWQLGFEEHRFTRRGMREAQRDGMERDALVGPAVMAGFFLSVARVAEDGMAVVGEVDADLIAAAGFEADFDDGGVEQCVLDAVVSDGELAAVIVRRPALIEAARGFEVGAESAGGFGEDAGHDGDVESLGLALFELVLQALEHGGGFGENEEAAHAAIQPVGDEGFELAAGLLEIVGDTGGGGGEFASVRGDG